MVKEGLKHNYPLYLLKASNVGLERTSHDDEAPKVASDPTLPGPLGDERRDGPLLDVGLPEVRSFASGENGLVPGAVACDADVLGEEELEDESDLVCEKKHCSVCEKW